MCEQLGSACVIDLTLDMRRRTALQRTVEESRVFQETLESVAGVLRGDKAGIENLVRQIKTSNESDILDTLQVMFQSTQGSGSRSTDRQVKEEVDELLSLMSEDDEVEGSSSSFAAPNLSRKRQLSSYNEHGPTSSIEAGRHESEGDQEDKSFASRYLPFISKLRTLSDWEAGRMLHDFKASPIETEGFAALNFFEKRPSRSTSVAHTEQYPWTAPRASPDRRNWHPSLQITTSGMQMPFEIDSQRRQNYQRGRSNSSWVGIPHVTL